MILITCQAGFEQLLSDELQEVGLHAASSGPGWVLADGAVAGQALPELAFAHRIFPDVLELSAESVNGLAKGIADFFLGDLKGERIEATWPCVFDGPASLTGLGRRISAVEKAFQEIFSKRLSRVAKLAVPEIPRGLGESRGLFVWFPDFKKVVISRTCIANGPRRMADDDLAPSRSYLKVEEAYHVIGQEPTTGETVADLGAAPGGWSYSAAKRGAKVYAVDNGPLKGGALGHANIVHLSEDAFHFTPPDGSCDWLLCDLVEEPHHVISTLVEPWLSRRLCKRFIINLKFGRVDPIGLLRELRAPSSTFVTHAKDVKIRHLYHDREEFTVTGRVKE